MPASPLPAASATFAARTASTATPSRVTPSRNSSVCLSLTCGRAYPYDDVAPTVREGRVPHCACGGVLKPDIVFYGENLPEDTLQKALDACRRADLCLVLGSSLTVYPAAALPREAYECGGRLVIVNDSPTPLDRLAILRLPDLVPTFTELASML